MIEPRQEDIDRNIRSFTALTRQTRSLSEFIESISESMAYQQALVRDYKERELERIRADREALRKEQEGDKAIFEAL